MTREDELEAIQAIWKLFHTELLECPFEVPPDRVREMITPLSGEQLRGVILDAAVRLQKLKKRNDEDISLQ